MPWPAIAAIAGKVLAGGAAAGAAGGAGGAAAGGIGGMLGGGGGGGLMKMAGGLMGGGGGGQQQGKGGGMMGNLMNMAKMPMNQMNQAGDQVTGMLKAQNGMPIDPAFFDYLSKMTGAGAEQQAPLQLPQNFMQSPAPPPQGNLVEDPTQMAGAVQNAPTNTPAQNMGQPMPGAPVPPVNPSMEEPEMTSQVGTPTNPTGAKANEAPSGGAMNPVSSILGTMAANNGQYQTDERGITQVTESSDIMGDAMGKAKKGDLLGAGLAVVGGKMNQMSQMRRQTREEEQWGSEMERQMKRSSAYNDPNSVYYAAKDGASIDPSLMNQNNNLASMMAYQNGGGTVKREILGEEEEMVEDTPRYVQKGKSYHYRPNDYLGKIGTDEAAQPYKRTIGDMMYDVLHPRKPARVSVTFMKGGNTKSTY